jgi:hypothetical protein
MLRTLWGRFRENVYTYKKGLDFFIQYGCFYVFRFMPRVLRKGGEPMAFKYFTLGLVSSLNNL